MDDQLEPEFQLQHPVIAQFLFSNEETLMTR